MNTTLAQAAIDLLRDGWGCCVSCGKVAVEPSKSHWAVRCANCRPNFAMNHRTNYCVHCGDYLDGDRRESTICLYCSKQKKGAFKAEIHPNYCSGCKIVHALRFKTDSCPSSL